MGTVETTHTLTCICGICGIVRKGPTMRDPNDPSMHPALLTLLPGWTRLDGKEACPSCTQAFKVWVADQRAAR